MTHEWLVTCPGWGLMDEVALTMRAVDLVDELELHIIAKELSRPGGRRLWQPIDGPSKIRRRLSKTTLVNSLNEEIYHSDSSICSDTLDEVVYDSIETALKTEKFGPAELGLDLSTMPRLLY
jgi:hypothetical protein